MDCLTIDQAVLKLKNGEIIAYPTEAVFGLGCDPHNIQALQALISLKGRTWHKGFILIASTVEQVLPYLDLRHLPAGKWEKIKAMWPGPYTWVFPTTNAVLPLIQGDKKSVAVRVTAHPVAKALCDAFNDVLVSTSANSAGAPPLKSAVEVKAWAAKKIGGIVSGEIGNALRPTAIYDALTDRIYR